jgi:hypothetical protein
MNKDIKIMEKLHNELQPDIVGSMLPVLFLCNEYFDPATMFDWN